MIRRPRRTVPAVLVALALLAVAVLVTWSSVQVLLGRQPVVPFSALASALAGLTPADPAVLAAAVVAAVLGLALLGGALVPGGPTVLALAAPGGADRIDAGVTRRSLARSLSRAAEIDGVDHAAVRLGRHRVVVTARSPYRTAQPDLADDIGDAVAARLADIGLARPRSVAVRLGQPRRSGAPTSSSGRSA